MEILVIILLNLITFLPSLKLGHVSDDLPALSLKYKTRRESIFWKLVSVATGNRKIDHGLNLAVHTLTSVFMYLALGSNNISLMAALLFSVNPLNLQSSVWISGRNYSWCALFLMTGLYLPYTAFLFLVGSIWNPVMFFAPMAFIGSNMPYLALVLPVLWFVNRKRLFSELKTRRGHEAIAFDRKLSIQKLIVATKIYGYYFTLCLIPFKLTWYDNFMQSGAGGGNDLERKKALRLNWPFWVGLGLLIFMLYSLTNWTSVSWGIFWYSVCIGPYLNLYRANQEIATRYCYIPLIGLMYALAHFLSPVMFAFILGAYLTRTLAFYTRAYRDDYWLIEASVVEENQAWYAWHIRAHKRWNQQSYREALNMWVMAKMISPKEFKILFNIAVVLKVLKKHEESEQFMKQAEENIVKGQEEVSQRLIREYRNMEQTKQAPLLR